jgi:hypothetical protein
MVNTKYNNYILNKFREKNLYEDGWFLEKAIKDAGFVDVKVSCKKMYYGTWIKGKATLNGLNVDHTLHEGGKAFTRAIAGAVEPVTRIFIGSAHFADEHSMSEFIEDAKADLINPDYHIYGDMYVPILRC